MNNELENAVQLVIKGMVKDTVETIGLEFDDEHVDQFKEVYQINTNREIGNLKNIGWYEMSRISEVMYDWQRELKEQMRNESLKS